MVGLSGEMDVGNLVHLALPKGRMQDNVMALLREAGVRITFDKRGYRPALSLEGFETKILKPQNIVEMLHSGSRDLGFAGADWVAEKQAELEPLLDCELDPVRIVAAADPAFLVDNRPRPGVFRVATEYLRLTQQWLDDRGYEGQIVRAYGATEVFPPEDADCIADNTATGATLKANGLYIFDTLMRSSTFLYANKRALDDPIKRERIEHFRLLVQSVLDARKRVMLEVNVGKDDLEGLVKVLPCMREPTVSPLHGHNGFAVKAAVPRHDLPQLIKDIKAHGGERYRRLRHCSNRRVKAKVMETRTVTVERTTKETDIRLTLTLDGEGKSSVDTGLGFFDHMLDAMIKHSRFNLELACSGDLEVDDHHTIEDCALALGQALNDALGDRRGIRRFAHAYAPLDEAVVRSVVDLSGRPHAGISLSFKRPMIGEAASENLVHFFQSFATTARMALHVDQIKGENDHHIAEAAFKSLAIALRQAVASDGHGEVPSTKGLL